MWGCSRQRQPGSQSRNTRVGWTSEPRISRKAANDQLWILSLTIMCVQIAGKLVRFYGDQVPGEG